MSRTLTYWNRVYQAVAFDVARGRGRVHWKAAASQRPVSGIAHHRFGSGWFALYEDERGLIFQAGRRTWALSPRLSFSNVPSRWCRTLAIESEDEGEVCRLTYRKLSLELFGFDPTFDDMDLELGDFFIYVTRVASDESWQRRMRDSWALQSRPSSP